MNDNIVETVYAHLEAHAAEISKTIAERDEVEAKMKSGRYSQQAIQNELMPKWGELRRKVRYESDNAIQAAKNLVEQYRQEVAEMNNLDPAELTDDIRLLQSGITLLSRDIQGILKRNSDNRTMTQIVLRYAKEHGIDVGGTFYIGGQQEEETARNLDGIIHYFSKWIDKPNAKEMLDKFFNIQSA